MLAAYNLGFDYRSGSQILDDVNFTVPAGQSTCLLGPNGTGKTTLLRCLLGLHRPTSGQVFINGQNLRHLNRRQRAAQLAYVPQSAAMGFPYPVYQVVLMGRVGHLGLGATPGVQDHQIAIEALDRLGIGHLLERAFHQISGGERQLVLIARALAQRATVLILDEPTAALDFANQVRVLTIVRGLAADGLTVLMTSHSPDHAFLASQQVVMLRAGTIYRQGPTQETLTAAALSELYGTHTSIVDTGIYASHGEIKVCVLILDPSTTVDSLTSTTERNHP